MPQIEGVKPSVSAGELDKIESIEEWGKKTNLLTKESLMKAIPNHLKERSALRSLGSLGRDIIYVTLSFYFFIKVAQFECRILSVPDMLKNNSIFRFAFYSLHAVISGTIAIGLWVLAHECGHGALFTSQLPNDVVGCVLHTLFLVPYFSWQFTHAKHHRFVNHTLHGETHVPFLKSDWKSDWSERIKTKFLKVLLPEFLADIALVSIELVIYLAVGWPLYLLTNTTGGRTNWRNERFRKRGWSWYMHPLFTNHYVGSGSELFPPQWVMRANWSAIMVVIFLALLTHWAHLRGVEEVVGWYFGPLLVVNGWLVTVTKLHHTHHEVPQLGEGSFSWLRGALCTIDRPYTPLFNHLHHEIGSTHVLHHLSPQIPHYNAVEATECIKKVLIPLNLYRIDDRGIWASLVDGIAKCQYIETVNGVQFFKPGKK